MKLYKFLILIFLACLICSLISCNGGESQTDEVLNTENTEEGGSEKATVDPESMKNKFSIFLDGEYLCKVVYPERATAVEKELYNKVRERLKTKTGKLPAMTTDFLAYNDTGESRDEPAILVGKTNYKESEQVYADLAYGEARIEIVGNKLVIAFSSEIDANYIFLRFIGLTNKGSSLYLGIDENAREVSVSNKNLAKIPRFPYSSPEIFTCEEDSFLLCAAKATEEQLDGYCEIAVEKGYQQTDRKKIGDNTFVTLKNDESYLYVYYTKHDSAIKIAGGSLSMYAEPDRSSGLEETYTPYIASIPQPNNGQGYILRLPDGRFIIHDGGYSGGDRVYNTLKSLESGHITIAAWFISHPHGDHYPAFIDFLRDHGKDEDITIECLAFNYAGPEVYDLSNSAGKENVSNQVEKLYSSIKMYNPGLNVIKVHTGQTLNFGSVSVEILYTVEDILPRVLPNVNDSSLVIRVNVDGQSLLLLADTCYDSGPIMKQLWGNHLKSDIVQIAHHGMWPSVEDIYHLIQGETVLFPATHANMKNDLFDTRWGATINAALKYAKDIYISGDSVQIIELPHIIENNKEATMEYVKNYQK